MKKILYLMLCACWSLLSSAQVFESSGNYARLRFLTYDPAISGRLYASTLGNHIVVSDDNGATWSIFYSFPRPDALIRDLRLVSGNAALSFSASGAVHVLDLASASLTSSVAIPQSGVPGAGESVLSDYSLYDAAATTIAVVTTYHIETMSFAMVHYTSDGGLHWSEIYHSAENNGEFAKTVAISPADPNKIFLTRAGGPGAANGLWTSNNQGQDWSSQLEGYIFGPIAFNPENASEIIIGCGLADDVQHEKLYRSFNNGATWSEIPVAWSPGILDDVKDIVYNPSNANQIFILEENEILYTDDNGLTWNKDEYNVETSLDYVFGISASYNPFDANQVAITSDLYPQLYDLPSKSMTQIKAPFLSATSVSLSNESQVAHLYYGAQGGRHHKELSTRTASAYQVEDPNIATPLLNYMFADPLVNGRVFTYATGLFGGTVNMSADYGATTVNLMEAFADDMQALAVDPNNTNSIYLSTRLGESGNLFRVDVSDPGNVVAEEIITPQVNDLGKGVVGGIVIDPTVSGRIYISKRDKVFRSDDAGINWTAIGAGLEAVTEQDLIWQLIANPLNPQQLTIASTAGVFTSLDGGASWAELMQGDVRKVAHSPVQPGVIAAAVLSGPNADTAILYSADNGVNWQTVTGNVIHQAASQGVDFLFDHNEITAYIATPDLGVMSYLIDNVTLGTDQPQENIIAGLYPNPASAFITLYTSDNTAISKVMLYSLNGQLVLEGKTSRVDVSGLPGGVYIVKLETERGQHYVTKLVRE